MLESFLIPPVFLNPKDLLWMVGNVDNPESTVKPVTPIETAFVLVEKLYSLPQEIFPSGSVVDPEVFIPIMLLLLCMLHIISAFGPKLIFELTI